MKALNTFRLAKFLALAILLAVVFVPRPAWALAESRNSAQSQALTALPASCFYATRFIADVTIPDNTVLAPGAPFTKTWRIQNTGTCSWGSAGSALNTLTFVGGTRMANSGGVPLPRMVNPGDIFDISIPMTAPLSPGRYVSSWKLQLSDGTFVGFGPTERAPIYAQIVVSSSAWESSGICSYYVVRSGDWLKLIAARFGVSWEAIAQANHLLNANWIYTGQRLAIPCGSGQPPSASRNFTSSLYSYTVQIPAGWKATVTTSAPGDHEYVKFSSSDGRLPEITISAQTDQPPFTGFEGCDRNLVFRGYGACSLSQARGQNPASKMLYFQRGTDYFHIALLYEDDSALAVWDTFLSSFQFTN